MTRRKSGRPDASGIGIPPGPRGVLVHLAAGLGNIVLATPLLVELDRRGGRIDLWLSADYDGAAALFDGWSLVRRVLTAAPSRAQLGTYDLVVPAVPPFYWPRFASVYEDLPRVAARPPDWLFYTDEQAYYRAFAGPAEPGVRPAVYRLPIAMDLDCSVTPATLTIAPGCKTGEMAAKRWPYFPELAARFPDVAVVGTADDLYRWEGRPFRFPEHVRMLVDLELRETAAILASSGVVVGNDSGLAHIAAAVGTPVVMVFGPTPHHTLGGFPDNVSVVRAGLECEPCWFGERLAACTGRVECLKAVSVNVVSAAVNRIFGSY